MNFRLTFFLVVLLLIVGSFGIWAMWHPKTEGPASPTLVNAVFSPQPKSIQALSLSRRRSVVVAFARADQHWDVTAPIHGLANEQPGVFADQIRNLEYKDRFKPESSGKHSLEDMGLTEPRATVTFTDDDKKTTTLLLGKRTPAKTIYMKIDGDSSGNVYEVDVRWLDDMDKDPSDFRSKEFAAINPPDVTSFTVTHATQAVTVSKDGAGGGGGTWSITKPIATRGNTSVVTDLVDTLHRAQVEAFSTLPANSPITGLATPVLTVAVTTHVIAPAPAVSPPATTQAATQDSGGSWKLTTVSFGNFCDLTKKSIYARMGDSSEAVVVSTETFNKINKELNDLRDPAITPVAVEAASNIEIVTPGSDTPTLPAKITLTRKVGSWQIASAALPGDNDAVAAFLTNVRNLRANKYVDAAGDLKSIGLDPPVQTISLTVTGQAGPEVIEIGKPQSAEPLTPVRRKGEPTVYLVQTPDVAKLSISLLNFRDRAVETLSADAIHKIEIDGNDVFHKVTLEHQGTMWKVLKDGKTLAADLSAVTGYLQHFTPVMAKKWISASPQRAQPIAASIRITMDAPVATTASTMQAMVANQTAEPATAPGTLVKTLNIFKEKDGSYSAELSPPAAKDGAITGWSFEPAAELVRQTLAGAFEPAASTQAGTQSATQAGTEPATAP